MLLALLGNDTVGMTDIVILVGVLGYLVDRVFDARGWSRSSKTLRRENEDLVRRNNELEETVGRHEKTINDQRIRLDQLEIKIRDLEKHDLASVMRAVDQHEVAAERRMIAAQAEAASRHQEHVRILTDIRDSLRPGGLTP